MSSRNPRPLVTFPIVLRELSVLRVADVTPGMRRVTLGGAQLRAFHRDGLDLPALRTEGFDDHVKFFFADGDRDIVLPRQNATNLEWPEHARPLGKDYTPVRFDPDAGEHGEVDFDFVRHEGGVASSWAEHAAPGDTAWIAGPKSSGGHPEGADWLLVVGDETALPAIGRWLAEMPEGTTARVFVEVGEDSHRQDLKTRADAEITWLSRDGAAPGTTDLLEQAVRKMTWLPGTVFVWAAGETRTLKGIRRHLTVDRGVPREQTHITGYWRRAEPAPQTAGPAGTHTAQPDAHERLHRLTDVGPAFAIRAAATLGLVDLVYGGVSDPGELARCADCDPRTLSALLSYLVSLDVFAYDADKGYRLAAVGDELVEDGHSAAEYDLMGVQAALDLALTNLPHTARTGAAARPLGESLAQASRLGGPARALVEDEARWVAPGLVAGYDWSTVPYLTAGGHGAATLVNALVKEFPALHARIEVLPSEWRVVEEEILDADVLPRVEVLPQLERCPRGDGGLLLLARFLDRLSDDEAVGALAEAATTLAVRGTGALLLVEYVSDGTHVGDADADGGPAADPGAVLRHLRLKCAFGSGLRTADEVTALAARAGLTTASCEGVGWGHRLWVLRASAPEPTGDETH
ncbi:SIP domain-containing protein [Streptomyces sp. NPDC059063]|uniref:SIP domain-containing protein n=1 Tax=unclassified Streptomyces TaxID=2593676 RepID=UPI00368CA63C